MLTNPLKEDQVTRVPRPNDVRTDPEANARRVLGEQLLDMTRQWSYSRVTRRANFARHDASCSRCMRSLDPAAPTTRCGEGRRLAQLADECDRKLAELRTELAELDAAAPEPVAAAPVTMF